jgi:hypothetical protein
MRPTPAIISIGSSSLDRAFQSIQEEFRQNPTRGSFSAFVKSATVDAWRARKEPGRPPRQDGLADEVASLRRELAALRRQIERGGVPLVEPAPEITEVSEEDMGALEGLARMDFR